MKCTSKLMDRFIENCKQGNFLRRGLSLGLCAVLCVALPGCARDMDFPYEELMPSAVYNTVRSYSVSSQKLKGYASDLCLPGNATENIEALELGDVSAAGLFDVDHAQTLYAKGVDERVYPASTTKIMTALVALKYGDLDQTVTFSENALNLAADAQRLGLTAGDSMSLRQALNYLLVFSANDVAIAIAENVGGSLDHFVELMNAEAASIGAFHSHFTNPHGLHEEDHYTTAYDLYLMFNAAMKYDTFREIIPCKYYTTMFSSADGTAKSIEVNSTDSYLLGEVDPPAGITVLGGKTGTTDPAGHCLIIMAQNEAGASYISVVMKADSPEGLYSSMNKLLAQIPN